MASVDKEFADNLKANGGYYNGDSNNDLGDNPRAVLIIEYDNAWGGIAYGLVFEGELNRYTQTEFVQNPRIYWEFA